MAIFYKVNILDALKRAGYTTYRLRQEKLMGQSTLQQFRTGELTSWKNIDTLCHLLDCQPGDIVGYKDECYNFEACGNGKAKRGARENGGNA